MAEAAIAVTNQSIIRLFRIRFWQVYYNQQAFAWFLSTSVMVPQPPEAFTQSPITHLPAKLTNTTAMNASAAGDP